MILCEKNNVKLEVIDNCVVRKTFKYDISNIFNAKWLEEYNELRKLDPRYVEVYAVGPNYIDMRYIENFITMDAFFDFITNFEFIINDKNKYGNKTYTLDEKIKIISEYIDVLFKAQQNLNNDKMFVHTDLNPCNILISNNKIIIIDPDSCRINPELYKLFGDTIRDLVKIMHKYYALLQRKKNSIKKEI